MASKIQAQIGTNSQSKPWWNRPLWGNISFVDWVKQFWLEAFFKGEIPESTVLLYRNSLSQLRNIAAMVKVIDNEKFTSKEFIYFLNINAQVSQNQGEYQGLKNSIELLQVALETKDSFLQIEATETRYRAYSQQEFYEHIFELLQRDLSPGEFKNLVQQELTDIIPKVKTEEGKAALQSYANQLDILSKNKLGLRLLLLFKQYNLSDFSLLRTVAEIADSFYDKNLDSLKDFMVVVQINAEMFLKLGQIIQIPRDKNSPQTYSLILQYIALRNRHQNSFAQFQQLIVLLKNWEKAYNPILAIRTEYPPQEYKQPPVFQEEIPGLIIFNKYQKYIDTFA